MTNLTPEGGKVLKKPSGKGPYILRTDTTPDSASESPASARAQIPLTALRGKKSPDKSPDIALAESPDSDRPVAVSY